MAGIVIRNGKPAKLAPREADIFAVMHEAYPRGVGQSRIVDHVGRGDRDATFGPESLKVHICKMRRRLAPLGIKILHPQYGGEYQIALTDAA